jgi:threonine aldolase
MAEARYLRKRMGGGMRQVGVIAAAARVALAGRDRLVEDHRLARDLAQRLADRAPAAVDPAGVETNIVNVMVDHLPAAWPVIAGRLAAAGVKANPPVNRVWRIVTHRDVDGADAERLVGAVFG